MALSEDLVSRIDDSRSALLKVYNELTTENYTDYYQAIWNIRAEFEYIVAALKLLNDLSEKEVSGKWKTDFTESLVQIRAVRKLSGVLDKTLNLFNQLESVNDIIDFYKICWKIKEKLTICLNVVKPKFRLDKDKKKGSKKKN